MSDENEAEETVFLLETSVKGDVRGSYFNPTQKSAKDADWLETG